MKKFLLAIFTSLIVFNSNFALASVQTNYIGDGDRYNYTYPVVKVEDKKISNKINSDILARVNELKNQMDNKTLSKSDMTYYEKYEDDNIVSLLFYVNTTKRFSSINKLQGYTITYDKHTGEQVPITRYLTITLPQLQNALDHSKAYAVDGLDNGVNLSQKIPYVSDNYFICHDGSIGLLYQPGDLLNEDEGATKIIVSPETIAHVNEVNNP